MRAFELTEKMKWSSPNLAALKPSDQVLIFYIANQGMKQAIIDWDYGKIEEYIIGMIEIDFEKNYTQVGRVFAQKGFGPLLYYSIMAQYGWLAPHRKSVSDQAKQIWKYFWNNKEVERKGIITNHSEEYMSRAYRIDNKTKNKTIQNLNRLLRNGAEFIGGFSDNPNDQQEKTQQIWDAANDIATQKMKELY